MSESGLSTLLYVTHRPNQPRPKRIARTLQRTFNVKIPPSVFGSRNVTETPIRGTVKDVMRLLSVSMTAELFRSRSVIDNFMAMFYPRFNSQRFVLEYGIVFPLELRYLGNRWLGRYGSLRESVVVAKALGVVCVNDPMQRRCQILGAKNTITIPNYPSKDFRASISAGEWKSLQGLAADSRVVLFAGNDRLREIYGLDLMLDSWQLVSRSVEDAILVMLCRIPPWLPNLIRVKKLERIKVIGFSDRQTLANWINCADVCVAPRTPDFPKTYYNDQDSTKICEYASFEKPIVANNYLPSFQYRLVESTPEAFADGIVDALEGRVTAAQRHYWEELEHELIGFLQDTLGE